MGIKKVKKTIKKSGKKSKVLVTKSISDSLIVKELEPVKYWLSTGCTILDLSISGGYPGGFAAGRISHIYGPESSAKSVLVAEPMGSAQRQGGRAYMVDAENTFDFSRAGLFGLNVNENFDIVSSTDSTFSKEPPEQIVIEDLFDLYFQKAIEDSKADSSCPYAVGIDSLSAIPSREEMEKELGSGYGTTRAKMLSAGFRQKIWKLSRCNLALIFIDQTRDAVGSMYKASTVSGGNALKFYASTRLHVNTESKILNKHKKVVGINVHFKVEKNKIAPPHKEGSFRLLFDYGIDDIGTNLMWLKNNDPDYPGSKGSWFAVPSVVKKFNSLDVAVTYVEDHNLEKKVIKHVVSVWNVIHARIERKQKVR